MGAMQVLQWVIDYPEKINNSIHIAGALKHSAQNIAFHEVGRQAIMSDPNWHNGNYLINRNMYRLIFIIEELYPIIWKE